MANRHLEPVVRDYIKRHRSRAQGELAYFAGQPTDEDAVSRAGLAEVEGKKHPHQWRIQIAALEESRRRLLDNLSLLREAPSFDELHDLVGRIIGPIDRIGELAIYDAALRIGARFELEPSKVYLHRGTRKGAKALGLDWRREAIEMHELPRPLQRLTAREAEDVLCIYKDGLAAAGDGCRRPNPPSRTRSRC
jgi:hypothetical protein